MPMFGATMGNERFIWRNRHRSLVDFSLPVRMRTGAVKLEVLHYTIRYGPVLSRDQSSAEQLGEITKLLLQSGANPNATDAAGDTPLHKAVRFGQDDVVRLLLGAGATISPLNHSARPPYTSRCAERITRVDWSC